MDRPAAVKLIRDTFENSFDKGSFINLTKNLVKYLDDSKNFTYQGNIIPDAYDQSIQTLERVGKYEDADNNKIDVLIVRLKKEYSLERARTMQRNFVAWYLNGSRGGELKDAALVAFVSPDDRDWRFSLVRMDYNLVESPTGRVKVEKELTPARRYSFLVGESESSHTAQVQLLPILENDERKPLLSDFEKAFSIEVVTREFFTKYRDLFNDVKDALEDMLNQNSKAREDFEAKNVDPVNFAKKLLGQVVFLYFLQKKGWLGVAEDGKWGDGDKRFLRSLFDRAIDNRDNFFNGYLEYLFYDALARPERGTVDPAFYSRFNCKIPFLNGGLFDPINNYDWVHTDILLPNELFSNTDRTKEGDIGTGILDVFDRYNFTVKEDEPLDKEVAVDPEMLGKVFENLLEVKDRKSKGTYYTPREIVHYMCQESLINYLDTAINTGEVPLVATPPPQGKLFGKPDPEQGALKAPGYRAIVPREDIEALVRMGELAIEHDARVERAGRETRDYSYKLPGSIRWNAKLIDEKLAGIRVCDPAIGSGAFPVGLMMEIVRARNTLTTYLPDKEGRTNYHFKRHAIQNCLYGVDIDPGAVEIAKLRLWLSLVVDEEDIKQIQPLPNLDYKIVCGNSLLGFPFKSSRLTAIERMKQQFFDEKDHDKKTILRSQVDEQLQEAFAASKKSLGYEVNFDFEIYFSEVFHEKGGFDVVIANPPYVRADSGTEHLLFRVRLEQSGAYQTLYEKWDLLIPFVEKGLSITNTMGGLIYIVSNSICTSKYALKLLGLIQEKYYTHSVDYFEDMEVFEAGVIPIVLHVGRIKCSGTTRKTIRCGSFDNVKTRTETPASEFKVLGRDAFRKEYTPIVLRKETVNLGDICYISYGLRPNSDERYWKGEFTAHDIISKLKDDIHSKPYIEGKDLYNYQIHRIRYLEWGTSRVPKKLVRPTFPELYNRPKIMRGILTGGAFDESGIVCNHSIVVFVKFSSLRDVQNKSIQTSIKKFNQLPRLELEKISERFDLKYILSVLNSSFALKYLNNIRRHRLENYFYPDDFRKLPIPDIRQNEQQPFTELVDQILAFTKDEDYLSNPSKQAIVKEFEHQIDRMVYELYELTPEETAVVEDSNL
jgi:type I restriction-modification system DNA methylase subunit